MSTVVKHIPQYLPKHLPMSGQDTYKQYYYDKLKDFPPDIQRTVARKFDKIANPNGRRFPLLFDIHNANMYVKSLPDAIHDIPDEQLQDRAAIVANFRLYARHEYSPRQQDYTYILRNIRRRERRRREAEMINLGCVHKYASWRAKRDSREQETRANNILSKRFLVTSDGQRIPLNTIAEQGRVFHTYETLHRLSSLAQIMTEHDWKASFSVVTLPTRFHSVATNWNGCTPDDSHSWANEKWRQIRAILSKRGYEEGLDWMAIRTVEPHKDATPHYNFVVIGDITFLNEFNNILHEKYLHAPDADGGERGAFENRIKHKIAEGEEACNQIISYAAKYALKTYLPEEMHRTEEHKQAHLGALAWRQTWNIRAFSLVGFAPISLWRECRSKHYACDDLNIVKYAVETNWTAFQREFINIGKKHIKPLHEMRLNKYGEYIKNCIGHFIKETNSIIAERISKAQIIRCREKVTLIVSQPSESKPDVADDIKHEKWHPPPNTLAA